MRPIYQIFAENLNYYMHEKDISQTQLAIAMDVSMSIVSEWMNGNKAPRFGNLEKLCKCLGITYTQLLADRETDYDALTPKEERLLTVYKTIPDAGKKKLLEYANDLDTIYEKENH